MKFVIREVRNRRDIRGAEEFEELQENLLGLMVSDEFTSFWDRHAPAAEKESLLDVMASLCVA